MRFLPLLFLLGCGGEPTRLYPDATVDVSHDAPAVRDAGSDAEGDAE
jgi:hypothetical protein